MAVIVAVPLATPVTIPELLTVAMAELLVVQVTVLLVALDGATVAVRALVAPTFTATVVGVTDTPVTGTVTLLTVMFELAVKLPLWVVAVIKAVPLATPVTTPELLTVAMAVLLEDQVTVLLVAVEGATVAVRAEVPPTLTVAEVGVTETPVTGIVTLLTVMVELAVKLPLWVVAVILAVPAATPVTTPELLTVATAVLLEVQDTA